jgi:hypothetical protein
MKITTYQLLAMNGQKVRKATQVELSDGRVIRFMEKMTKREVLRQVSE